MPQSLASLHFNLIFSTKNREPFISAALQPPPVAYLGGILRGPKGCLVAAGGMPDHVHLLASLHRDMAVAEALRLLRRFRNYVPSPGSPATEPSRSVTPT